MKLNNLYTLDDFKLEKNYIRSNNILFEGVVDDMAYDIEKNIIPKKIYEIEKYLLLTTLRTISNAKVGVEKEKEFDKIVSEYKDNLSGKTINTGKTSDIDFENLNLDNDKNYIESQKDIFNDMSDILLDADKREKCKSILKGIDNFLITADKNSIQHAQKVSNSGDTTQEVKNSGQTTQIKNYISVISTLIKKELKENNYTKANIIKSIINKLPTGSTYDTSHKELSTFHSMFLKKSGNTQITDNSEKYIEEINKINNTEEGWMNKIIEILGGDPINDSYSYINESSKSSITVGDIIPGDDDKYKYLLKNEYLINKPLSEINMKFLSNQIDEIEKNYNENITDKNKKIDIRKRVFDNVMSNFILKLNNEVKDKIRDKIKTNKGEQYIDPAKKGKLVNLWKEKLNDIFVKYGVVIDHVNRKGPTYGTNTTDDGIGKPASKETLDFVENILQSSLINKLTGSVSIKKGGKPYGLLRVDTTDFFIVEKFMSDKIIIHLTKNNNITNDDYNKVFNKLDDKEMYMYYVGGFISLKNAESINSDKILPYTFSKFSEAPFNFENDTNKTFHKLLRIDNGTNSELWNTGFYILLPYSFEPNGSKTKVDFTLINSPLLHNDVTISRKFVIDGDGYTNGYLGAYYGNIIESDIVNNTKYFTKRKDTIDENFIEKITKSYNKLIDTNFLKK